MPCTQTKQFIEGNKMEPVINPWIYYLIQISFAIKSIAGALIGFNIFVIITGIYDEDKRKSKIFSIIFVVSILIVIFVPSCNVLTKIFIR